MSDAVAMSFKARMNNFAKTYGLRPQSVIQNWMFERFLERLSKSDYRSCFIIKGGVLITSLVGLSARSTLDMDATAVNIPMSLRSIRHAVSKIATANIGDDVAFAVQGAGRIRVVVEGYDGIRVKLIARFHGLVVPLSIDVTKGDIITPAPIEYAYPSSFSRSKTHMVLAYTVETVLAEKCEAILKRNVIGTRARDYYDVFMLTKVKKVRPRIFRQALKATFEKCGTSNLLPQTAEILDVIAKSTLQRGYWQRYQREFPPAQGITFDETIAAARRLLCMNCRAKAATSGKLIVTSDKPRRR